MAKKEGQEKGDKEEEGREEEGRQEALIRAANPVPGMFTLAVDIPIFFDFRAKRRGDGGRGRRDAHVGVPGGTGDAVLRL